MSETQTADTAYSASLSAVSAQMRQSVEIEIMTRDGDRVKIRLEQSSDVREGTLGIDQDGLHADAYEFSASQQSRFTVSIKGNISADEQEALQNLLQEMDDVSREFFAGDAQSALAHVAEIGMDSSQIAGFALDLSSRTSVRAVAAYAQTQQADRHVDEHKIRQAADFVGQVNDLLSSATGALQSFIKPLPAFMDLFNAVTQEATDTAALQQVVEPLARQTLAPPSNVAA